MTDYGRNGLESFKVVTGAQGPLPVLNCIKFRCLNKQTVSDAIRVSAKDAGLFTIDHPILIKLPEVKHHQLF
jgi:hypothetical protein